MHIGVNHLYACIHKYKSMKGFKMFIYKYTETCNSKGTIMGNIKICLPSERYGQKLVWGRLCHRNHDDSETCKNSINNLLLHDAIIFCVQVT